MQCDYNNFTIKIYSYKHQNNKKKIIIVLQWQKKQCPLMIMF